MPEHSKPPKKKKADTIDVDKEKKDDTIDVDEEEKLEREIGLLPPQAFLELLPSKDLTVRDFLMEKMPVILYDNDKRLKSETAKSSISTRRPRYSMDDVFTAEIPPVKWIDALLRALKARLKNTNKKQRTNTTVVHPLTTHIVFPIWIANAWYHLRPIADDWNQWRKTAQWLRSRPRSAQTIAAADMISQTAWGTGVNTGKSNDSRVSLLAIFASNEWMSGRLFEIYATMVNDESSTWWVAESDLAFNLLSIQRTRGAEGLAQDATMKRFAEYLRDGKYKKLLIPANLNNTHWILFQVDFEANTLTWGDSMRKSDGSLKGVKANSRDLENTRVAIRNWLEATIDVTVEDEANTLDIAFQGDVYSCGICVLNAIEHIIFNHELLTAGSCPEHRLRYFLATMRYNRKEPHGLSTPINVQYLNAADAAAQGQEDDILTTVYTSLVDTAANTHEDNSGFTAISFEQEHAIVDSEMAERLKRDQTPTVVERVLTPAAKAVIKHAHSEGKYDDRNDAREPAYMAPSTEPEDYSLWCSVCGVFGGRLLACAGCRVAVCCKTSLSTTTKRCLDWNPDVDRDDFVYYCRFCRTRPELTEKPVLVKELNLYWPRNRSEIMFRYDPAVLIVSLNWQMSDVTFGRGLQHQMAIKYKGHEDLVLYVEVSLDGKTDSEKRAALAGRELQVEGSTTKAKVKGKAKAKEKEEDSGTTFDMSTIAEFLKMHTTAKLIIALLTHSLDGSGAFVWGGTDESNFQVCFMNDLLKECLPEEVWRVISNETIEPHTHRTLILNLSCGASIQHAGSRYHLYEGHEADAILSFAQDSTVVGDISTDVVKFALNWTTTRSDYDHLIARTFKDEWVEVHRPVISRGAEDHTLYTRHSYLSPDGVPLSCPRGHDFIRLVPNVQPNKVVVTCKKCKSRCEVPRAEPDKQTELGRQNIIKIPFGTAEPFRVLWSDVKTSLVPPLLQNGQISQAVITPQPLSTIQQPNTYQPQVAPPVELTLPTRPIVSRIRPPFPNIDVRQKDMTSPSPNPSPVHRKSTRKLAERSTSSATLMPPPTSIQRSNSAPQEPTALEPALGVKRQRSDSNLSGRNKRGKPGRGGKL